MIIKFHQPVIIKLVLLWAYQFVDEVKYLGLTIRPQRNRPGMFIFAHVNHLFSFLITLEL